MRLILGGVNGHYLRNITEDSATETDEVWAAVAYATDSRLLFEWCLEHEIPLKFYGRLDDTVAVSSPILRSFLERRSPEFDCYLVQHHHAKVIWWRGVGVYIGSANLTDHGWYRNIEAGCFMGDDEINGEIEADLRTLFSKLHEHATLLTDEVLQAMAGRAKVVTRPSSDQQEFLENPSFKTWPGLVHTAARSASETRRQLFLDEWNATLKYLRDISIRISRDENRPDWIRKSAPAGSQADQFLHAHYDQRTMVGRKSNYAALYEKNKHRREAAMKEATLWWRGLKEAPGGEEVMLNVSAPFLRGALAKDRLESMKEEQFRKICMSVHAIKDYARRVENRSVGLPSAGTAYTIPEKVNALSQRIWNDRSANGATVVDMLRHVLYGGAQNKLPERLWQAISDPAWKIKGIGVSALGELVGWAQPDRFPPRNGRTSKALRSLGYDVDVHVG